MCAPLALAFDAAGAFAGEGGLGGDPPALGLNVVGGPVVSAKELPAWPAAPCDVSILAVINFAASNCSSKCRMVVMSYASKSCVAGEAALGLSSDDILMKTDVQKEICFRSTSQSDRR